MADDFRIKIEKAQQRFSKEQIRELSILFNKFDINGDGNLSNEEITKILEKLEIKISKDVIADIFKRIDIDNNNSIEFDEFLGLMFTFYEDTNPELELREAFDVFDMNADSYISYEDLKEFLTVNNLYNAESDELIRDMIRYTDTNKDSKIDFDEFTMMYAITKDTLRQLKEINSKRVKQKETMINLPMNL